MTLSEMREYREQMLEALTKHDWLAYNFPTPAHHAVADELVADGRIREHLAYCERGRMFTLAGKPPPGLDPAPINPRGLTDPAPAPRASRPRPGAARR
jgi:hypothetical protein